MCGVSAGAICWCRYGNSDSRNFSQLIRVSGLGFADILFCPHINKETFRAESLKWMMKKTYKIPAFALDNAALEIVGSKARIIRLDHGSTAKKCYWKNGKYVTEEIHSNEYQDINVLFAK